MGLRLSNVVTSKLVLLTRGTVMIVVRVIISSKGFPSKECMMCMGCMCMVCTVFFNTLHVHIQIQMLLRYQMLLEIQMLLVVVRDGVVVMHVRVVRVYL